jgi:hypothetical protein
MHIWNDETAHGEMRVFALRVKASCPNTLADLAGKMLAPQDTHSKQMIR